AEPTGTTINAQASVVFDNNAPISTNVVTSTIDAGLPASSVSPLPAVTTTTSFPVSWSGSDDAGGSGIANYDIYVSDDGGPFALWLSDTPEIYAIFDGEYGHTYGFYSLAMDNVGNRQTGPTTAEATTSVEQASPTTISLTSDQPGGSEYGQTVTF